MYKPCNFKIWLENSAKQKAYIFRNFISVVLASRNFGKCSMIAGVRNKRILLPISLIMYYKDK